MDKKSKPMVVIDADSDGFYLARINVHGSEFESGTEDGYITGEGDTADIALSTAITRLGHAALRCINRSR